MLNKILSSFGYSKNKPVVVTPEESEGKTGSNQAAFTQGYNGSWQSSPFYKGVFGGETTVGGIRNKVDYNDLGSIDYYSLRTLSRKLFVENKYAGMALGRLSTNVINEGLRPQSMPSKHITGMSQEQTVQWTEKTEELFNLWASDETVDYEGVHNFSAIQKVAYMEALVEGDVLIETKVDEKTGLPSIKIISGRHVANGSNSLDIMAKGNTVEYGVELNKKRQHIAYHIRKRDQFGRRGMEVERILAKGKKSKRVTAKLVYESPPPAGSVRGFPILTRILQAADQVETYAVYESESAKLNASIAMWVEKTKDRAGSLPLRGVRKKGAEEEPVDATPKSYTEGSLVIQEVAHGEKPQSFKTDRPNVNFKAFKDAILEDIAAALEIPPEILQLKFGNNYSASRQAEIEFKSYVRKARKYFSDQFNKCVYNQWLTGMVFRSMINAPNYTQAVLNNSLFVRNGWQKCKWVGFVKQNVDIFKEAKAYELYMDNGLMTREQAASELTESDYRSNAERLVPENEMLAKAKAPLPGEINTSKSIVSDNTPPSEEDEEEDDENNKPPEDDE